MTKRSPSKNLIAAAAGTVLFFLLGSLLSVPAPLPGGRLPLEYGLLSFLAAVYGPLPGLAAGLLGRLFADLVSGAGVWWSWIAASGAFGLLTGLAGRRFRFCRRPFGLYDAAVFILCAVVLHLVCRAVLAPVLDAALYGEPVGRMLLQGLVAAALGAIASAVLGTVLCFFCSAVRRRRTRRRRAEADLPEDRG